MAIKLEVGKFKEICYFRNDVNKAQKGAGYTDGYLTFLETRGWLTKQNGSREIQQGIYGLVSQWVLYCRFQPTLLTTLNTSTKVWVNSRCFTISSYEQVDQERLYYKFVLNEFEGNVKISSSCYY